MTDAPTRTPLEFKTSSGPPTLIIVSRGDEEFEVRVGLAVLSITDTGVERPDGLPTLEVKTGVSMDVRRTDQ